MTADIRERMGTRRSEQTSRELEDYFAVWGRGKYDLAEAAAAIQHVSLEDPDADDYYRFEFVREAADQLFEVERKKAENKLGSSLSKTGVKHERSLDKSINATNEALMRKARIAANVAAQNLAACLDIKGDGLIYPSVFKEAQTKMPVKQFDPEPKEAADLVVPVTLQDILKPLRAEVAYQNLDAAKLIRRYDKDKSKLIDVPEFALIVRHLTGYDPTPKDM